MSMLDVFQHVETLQRGIFSPLGIKKHGKLTVQGQGMNKQLGLRGFGPRRSLHTSSWESNLLFASLWKT